MSGLGEQVREDCVRLCLGGSVDGCMDGWMGVSVCPCMSGLVVNGIC